MKRKFALTVTCTTRPKDDQILAISVEIIHEMGFMRAEQV